MNAVSPIVLEKGAGELWWYDGGLFTFKATGAQTGGAFLLIEAWIPGGKMTPLHVHPEADETFYVTEGEILAHVAGNECTITAGGTVVIPRGVAHAFAVTSKSARIFGFFTPASAISEAYFRAVGEPATTATLPPPAPVDIPRMMAVAQQVGLQILGPPPFPALMDR